MRIALLCLCFFIGNSLLLHRDATCPIYFRLQICACAVQGKLMLMDLSSLPSKRDQQPLLLARSERCRSSAQWYSRQITMPHFTGANKANTLMAVSTARLIKEYSTFSLIRWAPNPTEKKACVLREMETSSCARPSGPGPIIRSQAGSTGWDKQQGLTPYVGPCSCSPHGSSSKGSGDWGLVNHSSNYCTAWDALN
jgi:hypothetical protein